MPSDSTVDPSLIGRMIHTNDNDPGSERRADQQSGKLVSPSAQIAGLSSPEFLHCGVWPPPPEDDNERPPGLPFDRETQIVAATAPPAILSAANKACEKSVSTPDDSEWSGMSSEAVCGSASTSDEDASRTEQAGPSVPSWEELSSAMDTWIIKSSKSREHDCGSEKATMPYSVLKLLARHKSRQTYDDAPKTASQKLFDQELKAEAQARVEITEYIDQLVDHAEYEEAYVCVWRLEEYRREGWAKEMVAAHPHESCGFIRDLNRRQSRARRP